MALLAYLQIAFDPILQLGDFAIRWQTVGVAIALIVGVAMAAQGRSRAATARARPARRGGSSPREVPNLPQTGALIEAQPLRLDDMAFILLAAMPGAVVGGRLVHGLVYWPAYAEHPDRLLDPAFGSLSLLGAVIGGTVTAALMARLLNAPVRRWSDAAAIPLLVALGLGKLAQFLGGSGQGLPSSSQWAVAFVGEGPWVSPSPSLPAHAAQVYEGVWLLVGVLLVLSLASAVRQQPSRTGALFAVALVIFLLGRLVVGFSWRDEVVVGPLNAEQLAALLALVLFLGMLMLLRVSPGRARYREGLQSIERGGA